MARQRLGGDFIGGFTQDGYSNDPWGSSGGYNNYGSDYDSGLYGEDPWGGEQESLEPEEEDPWVPQQPVEGARPNLTGAPTTGTAVPREAEPIEEPEPLQQDPERENVGVLASYDPAKLASPEHAQKSPKYAWLQIAQKYPNTPEGFQQAFAEAQERYPQFFGNWQIEGDDSLTWTGEGELAGEFMGHTGFDVWRNASNDDPNVQSAWNWESHQGAEPDSGAPSGGSGGPGSGGAGSMLGGLASGSSVGGGSSSGSSSGSTTMTSSTVFTPPPGVGDELWAMLMERAKQGLNVDRNNPAVRAQADAYSAQEERARRNYLGDAAERNSPYGTGHMAGMERVTAAGMGQRVGAFEAELIGREITAKRDEIKHALNEMGDLLTDQQRMTLQQQLAEMDNALEHLKANNQNSQYYAGLNQREGESLRDNSYRWGALHQDQGQFDDRLAYDVTGQRNYWDWKQRGND